ncbi:MAG TPA: O-antigen ligase family protein [Candidatus Eremiobacteraceae bacterium]|nr:O-antigen ligase family protein [Candidatus Eremiobacteraceae bacterium]
MSAHHITESYRSELATRAGTALLYGLFGLLLVGPLAFGAVEAWSIFLVEAGSAALLLLWIGKQILDGRMIIRRNSLFLPMGIFGLLIASQLVFRISAYPHDTMSLALLYASYGVLCFLSSQTLLRGSQARRLALIFSVYGAAVAGLALIQGISSNGKLYWIRQPRMGGWIYGPYVNHNHYAGLMEMLVPIPLVLSLTRLAPAKHRNIAAAAAALMVGTIFLSESRGGMLAIVVELVILAIFLVKQKKGLRTAIGLSLFLAIVVGLLTWIGGAELIQRIASVRQSHSELPGDIRTYINRDGFRMFLMKPVLGWGLGAFPVVYPQFRSFYTNFFVNEAHNDYLQLLVEMGALGFATMLWFLVIVYARAIKKIGNWSEEISGAVALACLLGLSGILVHSLIDFNLQIPANASLFYVLCTIAASEPFVQPMRKRRTVSSIPSAEVVRPQEALEQSATNF